MSELDIQEYADYDTFVEAWHAEENPITATETQMLWQLLGHLDAEERLIQLPQWLADKKVGFVDGAALAGFFAPDLVYRCQTLMPRSGNVRGSDDGGPRWS